MSAPTSVAVLGAGGTMGRPMARNLARAGFRVRAWNRSADKARALEHDGAEVLERPEEAARGADILLTMLADTDAVLECARPALKAASPETLWLQMSTLGERGIERCLELADEFGVAVLDAPVLGTRQPAEQGALVVLAAGEERLRERARSVFDALGQRTIWVGDAGSATRLKLVANSWVLTVVEGCAETLALARGLGVEPGLFFEAIEGGALDLPYLRLKAAAILDESYEPHFRLRLAAKDARLITEAAGDHGLDLPLFETVAARMTEGVEHHGDQDMAATYFASAPRRD